MAAKSTVARVLAATLVAACGSGGSSAPPITPPMPPQTFPACTVFPEVLGGPSPGVIGTGDFNGDGHLDVLGTAGDPSGFLATFLGNGDGTFTPGPQDYLWVAPAVVADLDGDRLPEVVTIEYASGDATHLQLKIMHAANPTVVADGPVISNVPAPSPFELDDMNLVAGDFDGDGHVDIGFGGNYFTIQSNVQYDHSTVRVYAGNGDGTLQAERIVDDLDQSPVTYWNGVVAGDVNGDGRTDIVTMPTPGNPPRVYLGGVGPATTLSFNALDVQLADVNGDGKLDIVETDLIALGHGDGTFGPPIAGPGEGGSPDATGDVDGDGKVDIVATRAGAVEVFRGNGDGTFGPEVDYRVRYDAPYYIAAGFVLPAIADFNQDGHADIFVGNDILLGQGGGKLRAWRDYAVGDRMTYASTVSADLDADGKPDMVVATNTRVRVLFGGHGDELSFGPDLSPAVTYVATANVDGDDLPDVVGFDGASLITWRNLGGGAFADPVTSGAPGDAWATGDLDGDGRADVAVVDSSHLTLFHGNGDGTFTKRHQHARYGCTTPTPPTPRLPPVATIADVDADGHADVVTGDCGNAGIWRNTVMVT